MLKWRLSERRDTTKSSNRGEVQILLMPMPMPMPIAVRLAIKYNRKRVHEAMEGQYKEMGMTSIVFVCYTRPDGKIVIDA
jgi:hypothetical protein